MFPGHCLYNCVRGFGALFLGYDHLHLVDDFRMGYEDIFGKLDRASVLSEDKKEAAAKNEKKGSVCVSRRGSYNDRVFREGNCKSRGPCSGKKEAKNHI
jgi:hypothetical protein